MSKSLTEVELGSFLGHFRNARYAALEDAENFTDICFLIEELGSRLSGKKFGLHDCKPEILKFCGRPEDDEISNVYTLLKESRNDKAHKGVYARSSTHRALKICIAIEEKLVSEATKQGIRFLMTENLIFAQDFFSIGKLREIILENSFSYLPYKDSFGKIRLISDLEVARTWKALLTNEDKYIKSFIGIIKTESLPEAAIVQIDSSIESAIEKLQVTENRPVIVLDAEKRVRGILTAFDLL